MSIDEHKYSKATEIINYNLLALFNDSNKSLRSHFRMETCKRLFSSSYKEQDCYVKWLKSIKYYNRLHFCLYYFCAIYNLYAYEILRHEQIRDQILPVCVLDNCQILQI